MHRIDTPTAQTDKFGAGKNGFTNGDSATGRRATQLDAEVFDAYQEELCNVIEAAGIKLDKSNHTQLLAALKSIVGGLALLQENNLSDVDDAAKALANLKGLPLKGGSLSGALTVNSNGQSVCIKPTVDGGGYYYFGKKFDGTNHFYLGQASANEDAVTWANYLTATSISQRDNAINLSAETVFATKAVQAGGDFTSQYVGNWGFASQYTAKAAFYQDFTTTGTSEYHPVLKQRARLSNNAWAFSLGTLVSNGALTFRLHMIGSAGQSYQNWWDTAGNYYGAGQIVPANYTNFDARYAAKGSSGSTTRGTNSAYYKHANGQIFMQSVSGVSLTAGATVTITLPASFANGIIGVGGSYYGSGGSDDDSYWTAQPVGKNQIKVFARNAAGTFSFVVTGW